MIGYLGEGNTSPCGVHLTDVLLLGCTCVSYVLLGCICLSYWIEYACLTHALLGCTYMS